MIVHSNLFLESFDIRRFFQVSYRLSFIMDPPSSPSSFSLHEKQTWPFLKNAAFRIAIVFPTTTKKMRRRKKCAYLSTSSGIQRDAQLTNNTHKAEQ